MMFKNSLIDSCNGSIRINLRVIEKNIVKLYYRSFLVSESLTAIDIINLAIERQWVDKNRYIKLCMENKNHFLSVIKGETCLLDLPTNLTISVGDYVLQIACDEVDITVYLEKVPFLFTIKLIEQCISVLKRLGKYLNIKTDNKRVFIKKCNKYNGSIELKPETVICDLFDLKTEVLFIK